MKVVVSPEEVERAALVSALARTVLQTGGDAGLLRDEHDSDYFVAVVDLEGVGQVSFRMGKEFLPFFAFLSRFEPTLDGHSMTENSRRLVAYAKLAMK